MRTIRLQPQDLRLQGPPTGRAVNDRYVMPGLEGLIAPALGVYFTGLFVSVITGLPLIVAAAIVVAVGVGGLLLSVEVGVRRARRDGWRVLAQQSMEKNIENRKRIVREDDAAQRRAAAK